MPPRLRFATAVLASGALLLASSVTHAQVDRSAVTGTVSDDAGKLMRDTRVTATEIATGLRRDCVTSESGDYVLPELPVGTYTLTFQHAGFAQLTYTGVLETVGRTRTLNAVLHVAVGTEQVQVSDVASEINQNSDALGARIEAKQVQQLPLNGRDWSTLTALVPGAVDTGGSNQRTIRFAGRGLDDNNFTYDGVDATNIVNQAQQPFVRLAIPTESIQAFRIDTMLLTAESGSTPGGQVAVVSRTGSNVFHGNIFEFLRNDIFDARAPIDPVKHPFRLNQFGGSIGGPFAKDKTFFFFTYEGLRQTLGQTLPGLVPSASLRAQLLAQARHSHPSSRRSRWADRWSLIRMGWLPTIPVQAGSSMRRTAEWFAWTIASPHATPLIFALTSMLQEAALRWQAITAPTQMTYRRLLRARSTASSSISTCSRRRGSTRRSSALTAATCTPPILRV